MMLKSPDLRYRVWRDFFLYLADSCYNIGLLSTGDDQVTGGRC